MTNKEKILVVVTVAAVGLAVLTSVRNHHSKVTTPINNVVMASPAAQSDTPVVNPIPVLEPEPTPVVNVPQDVIVNNNPVDLPVVANIVDIGVDNSLVSVTEPKVEPIPESVVPVAPSKPVVATAPVVQTRKVLQYQTVRMCGQNGCVTQQVPVWVDVPVQPTRTATYRVPVQPNYNYNQGYSEGGFPILGRIFGRR